MDEDFELFELLDDLEEEAKEALEEDVTLEERNEIPELDEIRSEVPRWMRVDDVVAVVADLKNSTQFNTGRNEKTIARFYEAYQQLVDAVAAFDPAFIDIQGDGLFALFDGDKRYERALAAGVTMKTWVELRLMPRLKAKLGDNLPETGLKVGAASGSIFVKKVGIRGSTEPIWAGKPVNWAAKCAQQAEAGEMIITDAVWERLENNDYVAHSCGCNTESGQPKPLWTEVEIERLPEGRRRGHLLRTNWCSIHGSEFCDAILAGKKNRPEVP